MKILKKVKPLYTIGRWKNVPVQLHWSLLIVLLWYYFSTWKLMEATLAMVAYALLILTHEIGHAVVAHWRNVRVYGISLYLIHGQCRTGTPYYEADEIWVAWGGVFAQIVLLVVAVLLSYPLHLFPQDSRELLEPVFAMLIPINLLTIIINLVPMHPLDGEKAWRFVPLFAKNLMAKMKRFRRARRK